MDKAQTFWISVENLLENLADRLRPQRATVGALSSAGTLTIQFVDSATPTLEFYARQAGFDLAPGDEIICLSTDNGYVVLGKLQRAAPTGYALSAPLTLSSLLIANSGIVNSDILKPEPLYQDTSDTAFTSTSGSYSNAATMTVTLPAGIWTVTVDASLQAISTNTAIAVDVKTTIDGVLGTRRVQLLDSGIYTPIWCGQQITGVTGNRSIPVILQYKCDAPGPTITARQPRIVVDLRRST